jgi:hypothetical protein
MAGASGVRAGRAYVEIGVTSKLAAGLAAAAKRIDAFGNRVRRIGTVMAGLGAASVGGLAIAAKSFASAGARIRDLSLRTGIAAESLSRLDYAASQTGANFDSIVGGFRRLSRVTLDAGRGLETAQRVFEDLGIDLQTFQSLSFEEQFLAAGDALSKITDESRRAALAQELFGRAGLDLVPIFENGASTFRDLAREADRLGITIDGEEAKQAKALDDAFTRVTRTLQRVVAAIGGALAPSLEEFANNVAENIAGVRRWINENRNFIVIAGKLAVGVLAAGAAFVAFGTAIKGVALAATALSVTLKTTLALKTAFIALNPVVLGVVAGVATFGTVWLAVSDSAQRSIGAIAQRFSLLGDSIREAFGGITDAIAAGNLELAGEIAITALRLTFETGLNAIKTLWTDWVYDLAGALVVIEIEARNVFNRVQAILGDVATTIGEAIGSTTLQAFGAVQSGVASASIGKREAELRGRIGQLEDGRSSDQSQLATALDGLRARLDAMRSQAAAERAAIVIPEVEIEEIAIAEADISSLTDAIGTAASETADKADSVSSRGTFSSFAASRVSVDSTALMREQVKYLQRIASNTAQVQGFGP